MTMSSGKEAPSASPLLSKEQLLRIERNKRLAQQRLLSKRQRSNDPSHSLLESGRPLEKKQKIVCPSTNGREHLSQCNKKSSIVHTNDFVPPMKNSCQSTPYHSARKGQHHREVNKPELSSNSARHCPQTHLSSNISSNKTSHGEVPTYQWQTGSKADFMMMSKNRFKIEVPYYPVLVTLFKKMGTVSYDPKSSNWNFCITEYNKLVDAIKKEMPHLELNLIPKPVVSLLHCSFRSAHPDSKNRKGSSEMSGSDMSLDWSKIDKVLRETLMQFQKDGVRYCVSRGGRAMIADDMGLGKTLQAIAVMSYFRDDWPLLIICPSSVRLTWAKALKRWIPSVKDDKVNVILSSQDSPSGYHVNIISYDLTVKMEKELLKNKFKAVIADESHFLKNHKTARYKAVAPIVKNARRALLLSGTPALSRPIELYTQINMLDRNFQTISFPQFGIRYCNGVKNHFGWNFGGASNMLELQLYMEESFMIRRMKSAVLDQLPDKRRQTVLLDSATTTKKDKDWKEMKKILDKAGTLKGRERKNAVFPLYEKTGRLKLPAIRRYITDLMEGRRKLLVFAHHQVVLDSLCDLLNEKSIQHIRIDGKTSPEVRQSLCDQFQHDEECLVAILSITTANAGLTLTSASTVVFAELFWNPGILVQAEDRAYRIGQHNSVNVHYLVACGTVDDFIWPLIQMKLDVLCQAGLAGEDFSKADSTCVAHHDNQMTLFDCFSAEEIADVAIDKEVASKATSKEIAGITKKAPEDNACTTGQTSEDCKPPAKYMDTSNWFDNLTDEDFDSMDAILTQSDCV